MAPCHGHGGIPLNMMMLGVVFPLEGGLDVDTHITGHFFDLNGLFRFICQT
jgi:hypothetical protein